MKCTDGPLFENPLPRWLARALFLPAPLERKPQFPTAMSVCFITVCKRELLVDVFTYRDY